MQLPNNIPKFVTLSKMTTLTNNHVQTFTCAATEIEIKFLQNTIGDVYVNDALFDALFATHEKCRKGYLHQSICRSIAGDTAITVGKEMFLPIWIIGNRLVDFNLTPTKLAAKQQDYEKFIAFAKADTLNHLLNFLGKEMELPLVQIAEPQAQPQHTGNHQRRKKIAGEIAAHTSKEIQIELETAKANLQELGIDNTALKLTVEAYQNQVEQLTSNQQAAQERFEKYDKEVSEILEKNIAFAQQNVDLGNSHQQEIEDLSAGFITKLGNELANQETALKTHYQNELDKAGANLQQIQAQNTELANQHQQQIQAQKQAFDQQIQATSQLLESSKAQAQKLQAAIDAINTKKDLGARLREILTSSNVFMVLTICVVLAFLPFTTLAITKYINIDTGGNMFGNFGVYILCIAIAVILDTSILVFAVNGKHKLAFLGSMFQFIFFSAKFDYLSQVANLWFEAAQATQIQFFIVVSAVCIYPPLLIAQFTQLAITTTKK